MKRILCLLGLGLSFHATAQSPTFHHHCVYDHAVQSMDEQYPGYKAHVDAVFRDAQQAALTLDRNVTYTIPVAIHVVWNDPSENIPECKVIEQIDILNEAYQRTSADTATLRPIFDGIVANPQIEFRLDTIIRRQTTATFYSGGIFPDISVSDNVKGDATGGSDGLDPVQYLNIWICSLGSSGILGYAYPPDNLANWPAGSAAPSPDKEGVVLDYRVVGRSGAYTQQGTTLNTEGKAGVHEVGHYLGLRHIWGDGTSAIFGIPDCNADDGVADTPNAGVGSNFACDYNQNTCDDGAGDLPDMIENFMDYSDEACQNSFTAGQVAIMHGLLAQGGPRYGLTQTAPMNSIVRPSNDYLPHATVVTINADATCTTVTAGANTFATESESACQGSVANDVWYSFTPATVSTVVMELSNVNATTGIGTGVVHELYSGTCGSLVSLGCNTQTTETWTNLTPGETYYLRIYSEDSTAAQSFDLCLRTDNNLVSVEHLEALDISVYPNPSSGVFNVAIESSNDFEGTLSLYNVIGQSISNTLVIDNQANNIQLDLANQANGVYYLEIQIEGRTEVHKLVLNR